MTPKQAVELIDTAGGNSKFAELLGLSNEPGYQQRINNWKRRGIPSSVLLNHQEQIRRLAAKANRAA